MDVIDCNQLNLILTPSFASHRTKSVLFSTAPRFQIDDNISTLQRKPFPKWTISASYYLTYCYAPIHTFQIRVAQHHILLNTTWQLQWWMVYSKLKSVTFCTRTDSMFCTQQLAEADAPVYIMLKAILSALIMWRNRFIYVFLSS